MNKIAFITGATSGIGQATALKAAEAGFDLIITGRRQERLEQLAEEIHRKNADVLPLNFDIRKADEVQQAINNLEGKWRNIDVLVNNAGISQTGLFSDTRPEDYAYIFDSNVKTAVFMTKEVLQPMLAQARGTVINISSVWGVCGGSLEVLYSASKAALIGFTKALAKELSKSGIRVSCVAPGVVDTAMFSCYDEQTQDEIRKEIPLGYVESPENIAESVYFLCTDAGAYYHGQTLNPNGGFAM